MSESSGATSAAALRREFDAGFAEPPPVNRRDAQRFVSASANRMRLALPLADIQGVYSGHDILSLPSPLRSQRGVALFGATLAAVHDLSLLVSGVPSVSHTWLVHTRQGFAVSFDEFGGQFDAYPEDIAPAEPTAAPHTRGIVRAGDARHHIIDLQSIRQMLTKEIESMRNAGEEV